MSEYNLLLKAIVLSMTLIVVNAPAKADIWDDPKNLKVLPEDISADELRATMRGFAINTGSRCSACHVADDERDFSTYDFSLDDKEKKRTARAMIRMVKNINDYLAETFEESVGSLVGVDCATCHRGNAKPEMLHNVLAKTYFDDGIEKAIEKYRGLRERYYGSYTYDFTNRALLILVEQLTAENELDAALAFADLNVEFFPRSISVIVALAQVHEKRDDIDAARAAFNRALEISPDAGWVKRMLAALDHPAE